MKYFLFILFCCFIKINASSQLPKVVAGSIQRISNFPSKWVEKRNVDIWLPDGYSTLKKYPVFYIHDGQMLFDSTTTWNKQEWGVDDVVSELIKENKIKEVIIVGIWNIPSMRHADYFPQKPFESLSPAQQDSIYTITTTKDYRLFADKVHSDNYLKFIVTELKPYIDSVYSTFKDQAHTFIAGSSMGGLISMYAICEYPAVFGGAACLSTHWPGIFSTENNPIPAAFLNYLKKNLPNPTTHKLYFDYGTKTLDAMYEPYQLQADAILKQKGYTNKSWMTQKFPGADHSEKSWNKRLSIPLIFLLGK